MKICKEPGCTEELVPRKNARGYCWNHYMQWQRANSATHTQVCEVCGKTFTSFQKDRKCCSTECGSTYGAAARSEAAEDRRQELPDKHCPDCDKKLPADSKRKYCEECGDLRSTQRADEMKSDFRRAIETSDYANILTEIEKRVSKTEEGCWNWEGRKNTKKGKSYPEHRFGNKSFQIHRLALEAKHQAPLGSQHAHHICANTTCVNPEHLQPVTHRENVAEMLARHSYLNRIQELEEALAQIDQNHPLLAVIEVA
jgi:hypothetical protein